MDDLTLSAIILFGGGTVAVIIGVYLVLKYAEKEERQQLKH